MTFQHLRGATALGLILFALTGVPVAAQSTGAVTIVLPEEPPSLEPCDAKHSSIGRVVIRNITEPLTRLDPSNGEVIPVLATEWNQIDTDTWRFKLREGVTFSDGTPFDAKAVIAAFTRLDRTDMVCNTKQQTLGGIDLTVTEISPTEVEITSSKPSPILPTMLTVVQMSSPSMEVKGASRAPIGTGPYALGTWRAGQDITLDRLDGYWGDAPQVAKATFVWRSESAVRAAMVDQGEADVALIIAATDATNPDIDFAYPNGETTRLRINTSTAPLNDVRVRKALNMALDLDALKPIVGDEVTRAEQLVPPNTLGYDADLRPFAYDPAGAKALLEEAKADGVPVDTQIDLIGRDGIYVGAAEMLQAMQAMWAEVGLNVNIRMFDTGNWLRYQNRPFPEPNVPMLGQDQHDNLLGDASFTLFNKYDSDGVNSGLWDEEVDKLIATGENTTGAERETAFKQAFARIHDDLVADVFMYHMVGYTRVGPRVDWKPTIAANSEIAIADMKLAE
ncbi:ABC transporter substrate-binding protein [Frigidibacter sp. MR17.14]|uniref:ABC transporter substrate-binding protein n=1 Tax=Frigidibacter sp. MR17.14 TaxID=3126509 RepID=UPI003013167C